MNTCSRWAIYIVSALALGTTGCSSQKGTIDRLLGSFSSAPILTSIPDQIISQGDPLSVDLNNIKDSQPGSDSGMSYTCSFDQSVDGQVDGTQSCSTLSSGTFDAATGTLSWTPPITVLGNYEFKVAGTNSDGTYDEVFTVSVRLKFNGIANYSSITGTGVTINWTPNSAATGYQIFKLNSVTGQYELFRSVTGGSQSGTTLTGLTPNTPYTLRVQALDSLGGLDGNVVSRSFTTTELVKFSMTPTAATVAAGTPQTITIHAFNADGSAQTIGGLPLTPQIAAGTSSGTFSAVIDNNDGSYTFTFTPSIVGSTLTIDITTNTTFFLQNTTDLSITAGPANSANSTLTVASSSISSASNTLVTATIRDAYNNPISSGATIAFNKAGGTSTGSFAVVTNAGSGIYTTTYTGLIAGSAQTLSVSSNGITLTPTTTIQVVPGTAFSANSTLTISSSTIASGNSATLTALLRDINNNPIPSGILVGFNKAGGTSSGSFGSVTNTGGGSYTTTYTGLTAGTAQTLSVSVDGVTLSPTQTIAVIPGPATLSNSSLTISNSNVVSSNFVTITASLRDSNNNPIETGITVSFTKSGGTSTGDFGTVTNQGNGVYNVRYTGILAGTAQTIRVFIDGVDLGATTSITVTPGGPSAGRSSLTLSQSTVLSGESVTVTTLVRDDNGNPISSGVLVGFSKTGGTSSGNFGSVNNLGNGNYQTTYSGVTSGTAQTIGVSVDGVALGPTQTLMVLPGAPHSGLSTLTISSNSVIAGQNVTLTATIKDANSNPISSGILVNFDKMGGTSFGNYSTVINQGSGVYTATYTGVTAGSAQTVQTNVNGAGFGPTQSIQVLVGAPVAAKSSLTITTSPLASGSTATLSAVIRDSQNNPITSEYAITFDAIGGSSTGNLGSTANMGSGTFTTTYEGLLAGSAQTIRVLADGNPIAGLTASLQVIPGSVNTSNSSFIIGTSSLQSGTSTSLQVALRDANNNAIASGATVSFSKTAGVSDGTIAAVTNAGSGNYTSSYTGTTMGTAQTLTLIVNGTSYPSLNRNITVTAGPPTKLATSGPANPLASIDCNGPYTVTLKDASNNTTTSTSNVTFTLSSSPALAHSGTLFSDSSCSSALPSLSISSGVAATQFYYKSFIPQSMILNLAPSGGITASDITIQNIPVLSYIGSSANFSMNGSGSGTLIDNKGGGMWGPYDVLRSGDYLFVADYTGNRILKYNVVNSTFEGWLGHIASKEDLSADCASTALGAMTPGWCTGGRSESSSTGLVLRDPRNLAADSIYLYVSSNNRILRFRMDTGAYEGWIGRVSGTVPPAPGQLATCAGATINSPTPGWCLGGTWTSGSGNGEFNTPTGLLYHSGKLYLADYANDRIQKINATTGSFEGWIGRVNAVPSSPANCSALLSGDTTPGWCVGGTSQPSNKYNLTCCSPTETPAPPEGLSSPMSIDTDGTYLYVADYSNRRIVRYTMAGVFSGWIGRVKRGTGLSPTTPLQADGSYTTTWTTGGTTAETSATTGFMAVTSVRVDGGFLYAADLGHRVFKVSATDGSDFRWIGRTTASPTGGFTGCSSTPISGVTPGWCVGGTANRTGNSNLALYNPQGIEIDSTHVYIADLNNFRVQRISKSTGEFAGWIGAGLQAATQWKRTSPASFARAGIDDYSFGDMAANWAGIAITNDFLFTPDPTFGRIKKHQRKEGTLAGYVGIISVFPPTGPDECVGYSSGMTPAWCYGGGRTANNGTGIHGYQNPYAVTADSTYLYIVNNGNERIDRVRISDALYMGWIGRVNSVPTDGGSACLNSNTDDPAPNWCIGGTAKQGQLNGMLRVPRGAFYDSTINKLFVVDSGRLIRINPTDGQFEAVTGNVTAVSGGCSLVNSSVATAWCDTATGGTGTSNYGGLNTAIGVTANTSSIFVSDVGTHRILKFNKTSGAPEGFIGRMNNATNLNVSGTGGACSGFSVPSARPVPGWCWSNNLGQALSTSAGSEEGSFNTPRGLWADESYVYVSDTLNHRLVRINATNGSFAGWKGYIASTSGMTDADCIAAGVGGVTPKWCTGGTSGAASRLGGFDTPTGIAGDANYLYVHEGRNNRIVTIPKN